MPADGTVFANAITIMLFAFVGCLSILGLGCYGLYERWHPDPWTRVQKPIMVESNCELNFGRFSADLNMEIRVWDSNDTWNCNLTVGPFRGADQMQPLEICEARRWQLASNFTQPVWYRNAQPARCSTENEGVYFLSPPLFWALVIIGPGAVGGSMVVLILGVTCVSVYQVLGSCISWINYRRSYQPIL
jgi:hypothetical protein